MKQSIRLGRYAGVPVGVHWSVVAIFALVTWELADIVLPGGSGGGARPVYWVAGAVAASLLLFSLLAHEASHAVVARRHGVGVRSITLWLFGGVAQLEGEPRTPGADFAIAAVGPGTSVALAGLAALVRLGLERVGVHGLPVEVAGWIAEINLVLAAFNLIPAAPLDGGRILRAALWRFSGNQDRAALRAARAGMGFGLVLIGLGLVELVMGAALGLWPSLLGWFLYIAARAEAATARERAQVTGLSVGAVMVPYPPVVPGSASVSGLTGVLQHHWPVVEAAAVVGPEGWLSGVVTAERVRTIPSEARATTAVAAVAEPIATLPVGRPDEPVAELLGRMHAAGGRPAVVLDTADRLAGIVTLADVARARQRPPVAAGTGPS